MKNRINVNRRRSIIINLIHFLLIYFFIIHFIQKLIPFGETEKLHHVVLIANQYRDGFSDNKPDPNYVIYQHRFQSFYPYNFTTFAVKDVQFFQKKPTFYVQDGQKIDSDYWVFRDVEANGGGVFRFNSIMTFLPYYHHSLHLDPGKNVAVVEEVIFCQHEFMYMFGHLIKDFLSGLSNIPECVRKRAQVVVANSPLMNVTIELLSILGYNTTFPVIIRWNEWIYARTMHCVISRRSPIHGHYGLSLVRLRDKIRVAFNLSNSPPTKYVLFNRPTTKRKLLNFDEALEALKKEFTEHKWYTYFTHFPTAKQSAYEWNQFKIIVCPTGSLGSNAVFMQPSISGMVSLYSTDFIDTPLIAALFTYNIYHTSIPLNGSKHWSTGGTVSIPELMEATHNLLHAIKTGKWLSFKEPFHK